MSKIKSLLSFALAATMLFSTVLVGVNAEDATPKTGTLNIGTATVEVGEPTATVDFTLTFDEAVKSPHSLCTIVSDYELTNLAVKSVDGTVVADDENLAEGDDDLVSSATVKISNNGLNLAAKKVIFESGVDSNAPVVTTIVFTATFDTSAAVAGTSVVSAAIDATNYDENTFALTVNAGKIVVEAKHEAVTDWSYDADNHWHACVVDGCTETYDVAAHEWGEGVETKPATETETGVMTYTCGVCPATKTEDIPVIEPECDHANATLEYAVVDGNCVTTKVCDCGYEEVVATVPNYDPRETAVVSEGLALKVRLYNKDIGDYSDFSAKFTKDVYTKNDVTGTETETVAIAPDGSTYSSFVYKGIASYEMTSNIHITVYAVNTDGHKILFSDYDYKFMDYIETLYTNNQFKTFAADIANYGAYAQIFSDWNTANLANANVPEGIASDLPTTFTNTETTSTGVAITPAIVLGNSVKVRYRIRKSDVSAYDISSLNLSIDYIDAYGAAQTAIINGSEFDTYTRSGVEYWQIEFDKLVAAYVNDPLDVELLADGVELPVGTVSYGFQAYAKTQYDTYGTTTSGFGYNLVNLCRAVVAYGNSASALYK